MKKNISLFIPVYNSAELIRENMQKTSDFLSRMEGDFEIIVVDDNSSDGSQTIGREINNRRYEPDREIKYVFYENGPSRRENLAKSFYMAKYDIIGFIDADFSCDVSYLSPAVDIMIEKSADVVIGSRYAPGATQQRRVSRRILSFFYNMLVRVVFRSCVRDHQCGLKVFRKHTVMPIVDIIGYDSQFIRGWFWDAEFLVRVQNAGLKIVEMPLKWRDADATSFDLFRELKCLKSMADLRLELWRSRQKGESPLK